MAAFAQRAGWFGWPSAGFGGDKSIKSSPGSVNVFITYARTLRFGPDVAQFTATVNGVTKAVSQVNVQGTNNAQLQVVLAAPAPTWGDKVVITYAPGGVPANRLAYASGEELGGGSSTVYTGI
jgi:hypothetical protein